ncbi:hypothetical protein ACLB2K_037003 [Fragaria x ananassa]
MDSATFAAIRKEILLGFIKGATGETGKFCIQKFGEAGKFCIQKFGEALVCEEALKTVGVSVEHVPAPTPVVGKKMIRLEVDLEVSELIVTVGTPKVQAAVLLGPPVLVKVIIAHILLSAAFATIWVRVFQGLFKKREDAEVQNNSKESEEGEVKNNSKEIEVKKNSKESEEGEIKKNSKEIEVKKNSKESEVKNNSKEIEVKKNSKESEEGEVKNSKKNN